MANSETNASTWNTSVHAQKLKAIIESWRLHYNAVTPHSSLDYLTPNEFTAKLKTTNHPVAILQ